MRRGGRAVAGAVAGGTLFAKHSLTEDTRTCALAQLQPVVRVTRFLDGEEIARVHELRRAHEAVRDNAGDGNRTEPAWTTTYLHADGRFARDAPELYSKLRALARDVDVALWDGRSADTNTRVRCIECHEWRTRGTLANVHHHDRGSIVR